MHTRESVFGPLGPMSRFCHLVIAFLAVGIIAGCGQTDISGEYIAKFTNGVFFLHLVETPDKNITGGLDTAILKPTGQIQYQNLAITGAADGNTISLSLKPSVSFLSVTLPISGRFEWGRLVLTGALQSDQPSATIFTRSDASEYQSEMKLLDEKSQVIHEVNAAAAARAKAAQQERDFVAAANRLVAQMQRFDAAAEGDIAGLPAYQNRMQAITAKMDSYLAQERQLAGDRNAAVTRGQISVNMSQGMIATDQLFNQVRSFEMQFRADVVPLMQTAAATGQRCEWAERSGAKPGPETSACLDVIRANPAFMRNFANVRNALQTLEAHYASTHETQQRLVDASQSIE